jgi:DNA polymerase I-like protein with 3'-5' exonuclease and polymerase domains/intein/homing endonuclease
MDHKKMVLGTVDNLDDIIDECIKSGRYAIDLETTGLNKNSYQVTITEGRTKDQIVGVCLSPDGNVGYYLPIRHRKGEEHNIPVSRVERALRKLVESNSVATFHHARFDQEFLQFSGGNNPIGTWDDPKKWDDTLILTYLINTREHNKGLKHQSKVQLGFEMIEIDELFPEDHKGGYDFSELDPSWEPVLWYAASDAICTYCLYEKISPIVLKGTSERKAQDQVYLLEKMCLPATRWMERVGINIDQNVVIDLIRLGQKEFFTCLEETYDFLNANLGRKVEPGWFSLLRAKKNLDDVDFNISDQIEEFRKEAKREGMDALDEKGHYLVLKQHNGEWPEKYDILSRPQLGPLFEELEIPDLARTEKSGQVKTTQDEIDRLFQKFGDQYPFLPKIKRLGELQKALGTYLISLRRDVGPDGCLHPYYNQLGTDTGRYTTPSSDKPQLDGGTSFPVHGTPATYDTSRPACLLGIRKAVKARKGKVLAACFAEGSLVSTKRGLIPVEQVEDTDEVLTEDGWKTVSWAGYTGDKNTIAIQTQKGFELQVTEDHLILIAGEKGFSWKEAKDLQSGDWVVQVSGHPIGQSDKLPETPWSSKTISVVQEKRYPLKTPSYMTEGLAEFLGRFMGDGSISHDNESPVSVNIALGLDVNELLPSLNRTAKALFDREFVHKGRGDVTISSRVLARWLCLITNKNKDVTELEVPQAILRGGENHTAAFLRGLFDADGSIKNRKGDNITLWVTSTKMSQQVQLMLLHQGIQVRRVSCSRITNFGSIQGWEISISGIKNLDRFKERIGFLTPRKTERLNRLLASGRNRDMSEFFPLSLAKQAVICPRNEKTRRVFTNGRRKNRVSRHLLNAALHHQEDLNMEWMHLLLDGPLLFDTVVHTSQVGIQKVYDVTVPEGQKLQVNGLLAHNCDFGGVELRIATNLSREPKWMKEYFHCSSCDLIFDNGDGESTPIPPPAYCPRCGSDKIGDLHTLTALAFYGEDKASTKEFKQLRQNAKSANFALAYGGGPSALMRATGCDENEGARHHRTFNQTYSVLKQWWDDTKSFAKRHGYVATAFGRQYPLPDIKLPITPAEEPDPQKREMNRKFRAKAERNATNGPIQGCIHPEERILTSLGFLPIEELDRLGQSFMVWTGKSWSEGRVFSSGLKEVRKTTLDSGRELKTSPDHRFLTWQRGVLGWTPQSELSTGDWVAINSKDISLLLGDGSEKSLWLGCGDTAPPELIKCVGEVVRASSIWATLTAPEKSAVSRLMVGSGSKPQCVKYLSRVPESEAPAFLWDYLEYDWERVTTLENLEEQVGMFDIEVFDKEHAFVANGVVVHNCSADLTKLAMGLIYKEVKKRDWFEKVHMIISIHDELVFEIDKDILAEALEVFQDIMTRNKAVLQLKWPVPLTTDCEIGYDWTVKWNLKDFQARRVRSDGVQVDEKGKPDGKVWPEEFIRIFGSRYGFADLPITDSNTKQDEESTSNIQASQEPTAPYQESKGVTPSVAPLQVEKPQRGDSYVFQLRTLSIGVADRLAQVIVQCEGRGTNLLEIRTPTGEIIAPGPEKIYVNPLEFATVAKIHGLLG